MSGPAESCAEYVIAKLQRAEMLTDPFPHVLVDELLPREFYSDLLRSFPGRAAFREARYPGTGRNRRASGYREHGLVCQDFAGCEELRALRAVFASEPFARTLLARFSAPLRDGSTPIPAEKHRFFAAGVRDWSCVFDLQIDRPGYEIAPHPDVKEKIVTFQLFLVPDDALQAHGTLLCRPRSGAATAERSRPMRWAGTALDRAARRLRLSESRLYRSLELSRLGLRLGLGDSRSWLPWELFEVVKVAPALPNHFLAFAPNERSYHAVSMNVPAGCPRRERPILRGFIRSGENARNWIELLDAARAAAVEPYGA